MNRRIVSLVVTVATLVIPVLGQQQTQLVFWNFNSRDLNPSSGVMAANASVSFAGGVQYAYTTTGGASPADPAGLTPANAALLTYNYAQQRQDNLSTGVVFRVSTVGYRDVVALFDIRWGSAASKYLRLQYTYDGTTWLNGPQLVAPPKDPNTGSIPWWSQQGIVNPRGDTRYYYAFGAGANNNPNFAFRIVAEFAPGLNGYIGASKDEPVTEEDIDACRSGYLPNGVVVYDLVEVAAVPEPASLLVLSAGLAKVALLRRRLRKVA